MTFTHRYKTESHSNSIIGTYESEEESFRDLISEEKKTVNADTIVPKMLNQLLDLFSRSASKANTQPKADTQPKGKRKVLGFEKHTIDLKMHPYHRSLCFPTIYQVMSLYEFRDVINNNDEGPHWLKFLSQAIAYNNATHKKAFNEIVTYKALARKCKKKVRSLAQRLVNSKERFIAKEIDNENLQTKLNDIQTQLANVCMQRKDNVATPTATDTKYKQLQQ